MKENEYTTPHRQDGRFLTVMYYVHPARMRTVRIPLWRVNVILVLCGLTLCIIGASIIYSVLAQRGPKSDLTQGIETTSSGTYIEEVEPEPSPIVTRLAEKSELSDPTVSVAPKDVSENQAPGRDPTFSRLSMETLADPRSYTETMSVATTGGLGAMSSKVIQNSRHIGRREPLSILQGEGGTQDHTEDTKAEARPGSKGDGKVKPAYSLLDRNSPVRLTELSGERLGRGIKVAFAIENTAGRPVRGRVWGVARFTGSDGSELVVPSHRGVDETSPLQSSGEGTSYFAKRLTRKSLTFRLPDRFEVEGYQRVEVTVALVESGTEEVLVALFSFDPRTAALVRLKKREDQFEGFH